MLSSRALVTMVFALVTGCAAESNRAPSAFDGGIVDPGTDADTELPEVDAGTPDSGPPPRPDAGPVETCTGARHMCGDDCVADLENSPENGCAKSCTGDLCEAPEGSERTCTAGGQCSFECISPWTLSASGTSCECTPTTSCESVGYVCGSVEDGCGHPLLCGACDGGTSCEAGVCSCEPDGYEPSSISLPWSGPTLSDAPDSLRTITDLMLSGADDVDWYAFPITDGDDGGNPIVRVDLFASNPALRPNLSMYYVCDLGEEVVEGCINGTVDNARGNGCSSTVGLVELRTDCDEGGIIDTTDENGIIYVKVSRSADATSCDPYSFSISVR